MGFVSSGNSITVKAYLTQKGRELYYLGDDEDIITKYFSLGDSDANYYIAATPNITTDEANTLKTGFVPDLTGDYLGCIKSLSNGVNLKYLINVSDFPAGSIVNQFCQPPYTLVQEISNGDGTTYLNFIQNSISCGFSYKNLEISKSFTKTNCSSGGIGQSYVVTVPAGQFTATTQTQADQLALDYMNLSGQTVTNNNGTCLFGNQLTTQDFIKNDCPNGGNPYTVTVQPNTFFSTTSVLDANNLAYAYLSTNGQIIANDNGTCKQISGYNYIPLINSLLPSYVRDLISINGLFPDQVKNDVKIQVPSTLYGFSTVYSSTNNASIPYDEIAFTFKLPINLYGKNIKLELSGRRSIYGYSSNGAVEQILFTQSGYVNNGVLEVIPDFTFTSNQHHYVANGLSFVPVNDYTIESNYNTTFANNANDYLTIRMKGGQEYYSTGVQEFDYSFALKIFEKIPIII